MPFSIIAGKYNKVIVDFTGVTLPGIDRHPCSREGCTRHRPAKRSPRRVQSNGRGAQGFALDRYRHHYACRRGREGRDRRVWVDESRQIGSASLLRLRMSARFNTWFDQKCAESGIDEHVWQPT